MLSTTIKRRIVSTLLMTLFTIITRYLVDKMFPVEPEGESA